MQIVIINCFHQLFQSLTQEVCSLGFADDALPRNCTVGVIFVDTYIAVAALLEDNNVRIEKMASIKGTLQLKHRNSTYLVEMILVADPAKL